MSYRHLLINLCMFC